MAGMGRTPKLPEERRNRAVPRAGEWQQLPKEGYKGPIPSLKGLGLAPATHAWWKKIWRTPMATMWQPGDVPALIELATLRERLMDGKVTVAPEVRLRSDEFGLTPKGRQERRWLVVDEPLHLEEEPTDELVARRRERKQRLAGSS